MAFLTVGPFAYLHPRSGLLALSGDQEPACSGTRSALACAVAASITSSPSLAHVAAAASAPSLAIRLRTCIPLLPCFTTSLAPGRNTRVSGTTVIDTVLDPSTDPLSVTAAVITWAPSESASVANDPPDPMTPSRSEAHDNWGVSTPSSTSMAVAANVTEAPGTTVVPSVGSMIDTVGGALPTIRTVAWDPVAPPPSVTRAVTTCTPSDRPAVENEAPLPIDP